MKKLFNLMLMAMTIVFTASCSSSDDADPLATLNIQVAADQQITDYSTYKVTARESKSGTSYTVAPDDKGVASFQLPLGAYNVTVENTDDNGVTTMYGKLENYVLGGTEAKTQTIKVESTINSQEPSFVLDELYFNGDKNGEYSYLYYESYITIRNNSDKPLYADGLSIGICGDYNSIENNEEMGAYEAKDEIVLSQLFTIPGDGNDYLVKPGESIVLAHSAINHKLDADGKIDATKPYSIDLSGADFEFFVPYEYVMTADNPEVKNMIVDHAASEAFNWGYVGETPIVLAKLTEAERKAMTANMKKMQMPKSSYTLTLDYIFLPKSKVIDGVETGNADGHVRSILPAAIDRTSILVNTKYGFDGQFIQRKRIQGTNKVADTNNSKEDFEIIAHGQKSYPKK